MSCGPGADHLHAIVIEHARAMQRQRGVERRLPAHGRQDRVGALLLDDLGDEFGRDRLDIGRVRDVRVGHDRRRVRIHQDDPIAFFLQRLAGLGAGIVEFAGLSDDDGSGADDQDGVDICAFGHDLASSVAREPATLFEGVGGRQSCRLRGPFSAVHRPAQPLK